MNGEFKPVSLSWDKPLNITGAVQLTTFGSARKPLELSIRARAARTRRYANPSTVSSRLPLSQGARLSAKPIDEATATELRFGFRSCSNASARNERGRGGADDERAPWRVFTDKHCDDSADAREREREGPIPTLSDEAWQAVPSFQAPPPQDLLR